jgi:hypothetical protein
MLTVHVNSKNKCFAISHCPQIRLRPSKIEICIRKAFTGTKACLVTVTIWMHLRLSTSRPSQHIIGITLLGYSEHALFFSRCQRLN